MKKIFIFLTSMALMSSLHAQTIHLSLPNFANKEYSYVIMKGDKKDTIVASGRLDNKGKTILQLPLSQKGYVGMSSFQLAEGGGLDIVLNNENCFITCNEKKPAIDNIEFIGSPENEFLLKQFQKQQYVLEKANVINTTLQLYDKQDTIYPILEKEFGKLKQTFNSIQSKTAQSKLYAARFREMNDFLMGIGGTLDLTDEERAVESREFMRNKINMELLYTSNLWNDVISNWVNLHNNTIKDDKLLLEDAQFILERISSKAIYNAFADKLVVLLTKAGKDQIVSSLVSDFVASGKIEKPSRNLLVAMGGPQIGMKTPDLVWESEKYRFDKKQKTILIFYEAGCNNCDNEINLLIGNYQELQKKGYEVVSAASDMDPVESEKYAGRFPWKKKFCDYKGAAGYNFISFGVIGTPTIFVIDETGTITGRYARLADAHILN